MHKENKHRILPHKNYTVHCNSGRKITHRVSVDGEIYVQHGDSAEGLGQVLHGCIQILLHILQPYLQDTQQVRYHQSIITLWICDMTSSEYISNEQIIGKHIMTVSIPNISQVIVET